MTTCTWDFRRHAGRFLTGASLIALSCGLVVPRASADQIGNLQAQAQALEAKITQLGQQEDALSQQYDEASIQLQAAQHKVAQAVAQVAKADAATNRARQQLKQAAVQAYVQGGADSLTANPTSLRNATTSLLASEYADTLATNQQDAVDQYHLASLQDESAKQALQAQQSDLQSKVSQLAHDKQAGLASQAQLQAALNQDKGQIATLIAQQQAAQRAAELAAAQARVRAQQAAQQQAAQLAAAQRFQQAKVNQPVQVQTVAAPATRGFSAPVSSRSAAPAAPAAVQAPPPPAGAGAGGAVAAAESRVGAPYIWGGAGPWGFDCSGLVMWAYAQVGISIPHASGAQYAVVMHIPMSALQPGDIVFVANPSQHEAMYIGGGMIVEAQHSGTNVLITPLRSEFVLAGRVV